MTLRAGDQGRPRRIKIGNKSAIRFCNPSDGTVPLQGTKMSTTPWECSPATSHNRYGSYGDSLSQSTKVRIIQIGLQGMGDDNVISQDVPKPANSICHSRTPPKGKQSIGSATGPLKQPIRPPAGAGGIDRGDSAIKRGQRGNKSTKLSTTGCGKRTAVSNGVSGPRRPSNKHHADAATTSSAHASATNNGASP